MKRGICLKKILLFSFIIFLVGCTGSSKSQTADQAVTLHPFSVQDMLSMQRISDLQVSPDGKWVAFAVQKIDLNKDKGSSDIWLVASDGRGLKQLTLNPANDSNPRWSPDGKLIYFLSSKSGSAQIWKMNIKGGNTKQITKLPIDVGTFIVSLDGKSIAFSADVFPGLSLEETKQKLDEIKKQKSSGRLYEQLFVRHWDTWEDGRRSHIFVIPANGGKPVDVMLNMDADCPSLPFGGSEEFCFTPDSNEVIFTARDAGRTEAWSTDFNLFKSPVNGPGKPVNLTQANRAWDSTPLFSPDGKTLAYLAMSRPGYESDRFRIILRSWPDGADKVLTQDWDRSPSYIAWSKDGKKIFAIAENIGQKSLFSIDVQTGKVEIVVEKGSVTGFGETDGKVIFGWDDLKAPLELFSADPDGSNLQQLTKLNASALSSVEFGDFEQFNFRGWNNEKVYGYVVKPAGFKVGSKYPIAFLIHGGPQGNFGNTFRYRWNPQVFTGAGYGVVMVDFHGSTGYGQDFCDSIRGDWGGKPLVDLQKGLEYAIKQYPWLDSEKAGALGASFGGYMINWIAGNWPDRFKCLVNHAGNIDERMAYFDTEELWFPEWDHFGTPWNNPASYEKQNPANFVQNWNTPMLVTHGGRDYRVVDTQGLGTFNALQRLGVPSKLLYFPDESHWILRPSNVILWHQTVLSWLDRWLK